MKLKIFCAVDCFLPGRAKDLSAPLYFLVFDEDTHTKLTAMINPTKNDCGLKDKKKKG
jgi:hypothetical protein